MNRMIPGMVFSLLTMSPTLALAAPAALDQAFVAKVSQGGMFEVQASKLAETMATTQDIRDFATAEVHDHGLVGDKLKAVSNKDGVSFSSALNAEFQGKLDSLKRLKGRAFDNAYMAAMADIHAKDGAAFAKEAGATSDPGFKAFAAETHVIVLRHIGAIHAAPPPAA